MEEIYSMKNKFKWLKDKWYLKGFLFTLIMSSIANYLIVYYATDRNNYLYSSLQFAGFFCAIIFSFFYAFIIDWIAPKHK